MMNKVCQLGNVFPTKTRKNPNQGRVYDSRGIAPTINCMGGGNLQPITIVRRHSYVGFDWRDAEASGSKI